MGRVSGLDIGAGEERKWQHDVLGANSPVEMPPVVHTIAHAMDLAGEYARAGANYVSVSFKWRSANELADQLEQFAREAIPAFR
jgi:hypothetical protein